MLFFFQDRQLKIKDLVLSAHERAVRNCPWTMGLWKSYLLALERHGADHHTVSGNICFAARSCVPDKQYCNRHKDVFLMICFYVLTCKRSSILLVYFGARLIFCLFCLFLRCFWEGAECGFHSGNRLRGDLAGLPWLPEEACGFQQRWEQLRLEVFENLCLATVQIERCPVLLVLPFFLESSKELEELRGAFSRSLDYMKQDVEERKWI